MKILMPFISRSGRAINDQTITGGIEKVAKNIYELYKDNIIPVVITSADRANRKTKDIFIKAVKYHKPDIVLLNDIDGVFYDAQILGKFPTIAIVHEPLCGDIRYMALYEKFHKFQAAGGHLYFVSEHQFNFHNKHVHRVTGNYLKPINGLFNSSYCTGDEQVNVHKNYDLVTIGRTDVLKDPFAIHKKFNGTKISTCVLTTKGNFQTNPKQIGYYESNLHWSNPRWTYRGLAYHETMDKLGESKVYVSTAPQESWGITAMEALAHGLPLILLSDKTMKHSSTGIAASSNHVRVVPKKTKTNELASIAMELMLISDEERRQISESTKVKHSQAEYKNMLKQMFMERVSHG